MTEDLLLATRNPGKLRELTELLAGTPFRVLSLADAGITDDVEETGETFAENAIAKAVAYSRQTAALTLADDSGLEVAALGGAPGVHSARYGGPGLSDTDRCRLLLTELERIPEEQRGARFVCVLALARAGSLIRTFEGTVEGRIAPEPNGSSGFGYDPVFYYSSLARTFAELRGPEKDRVSHRGQALRALRNYLDSDLQKPPQRN